RGRLETQEPERLAHVGNPHRHVVLEWRVIDDPEGPVGTMNLVPDGLCQLEDSGRGRRRNVEVLVARGRRLHTEPDAAGEVAAIGIVPDLPAVAEQMHGILAL